MVQHKAEADQRLADSEQRWRLLDARWQNIVTSPLCALAVVDGDGSVRFSTPAADRLLGAGPQGLLGGPFPYPWRPDRAEEVAVPVADGGTAFVEIQAKETRWDHEACWLLSLRDVTECRLTEEMLRENEMRFRTVLDSAGIGIGIDDLSGRTILCNPALERILGYSQAELRGMRFPDFTYPLDVEGEAVLFRDLLAGQRDIYRYEKRYIRKGGDIIWGHLTVSLLRRPGQAPTGLIAMVEDITDRKRTERALRQSEERWRSLAEYTPDVILTTDAAGGIRYANRAFEGIPAAQIIGRKVHDCVLLEHRSQMLDALRTALRTRLPVQFEFSSVAALGVLSWHVAKITPIVIENEVTAATVVITDISERKGMEDELRDYAHRLEQQVSDRTRKLRVLYGVTEATAEPYDLYTMLASSLEEVVAAMPESAASLQLLPEGRGSESLVLQSGLPKEIASEMQSGISGDSLWGRVMRNAAPVCVIGTGAVGEPACPPGFRAYLGVPIRADGQVQGVLSVFAKRVPRLGADDLELLSAVAGQLGRAVERSRLRRKADQAIVMEERQRLARDLHDSITQLLCSQALLAEASRKFVDAGDGAQASPYLHQLVDTAHQALKEMRLMIYDLRPSALEKEGLVGALRHRLDAVERRAGIQASLVGEISTWSDRYQEEALYRIVQELLNNVLRHAEATSVTVHLRDTPDRIEMEVVDNGKGFDPDAPSSGIGLKSIEERVDSLGGALTIASEAGVGSRVTVSLAATARAVA